MKLAKNIFMTLFFPALMFFAMLLITSNSPICFINGRNIFLGTDLIRHVILKSCQTISVALAIWLQMKNGRFDFSIGASMILTAIIAGNIGAAAGSPYLTLVLAVVFGILFNLLAALLYVYGRLPIIISSIASTLFLESLTYFVFGGNGIGNYYPDAKMNIFGRLPLIFIPTVIAMAVFLFYDQFSTSGRKGKILSHNQNAGVNIGIDEKKNVLASYVYTGIIVGMAAVIYVSQNSIAPQSALSTSGVMFSYIAPVFMGMFIGMASNDVIGILMASIGLSILSYGLNCLNLGAGGWQNIIFGVFVMCFYGLTSKWPDIRTAISRRRVRKTA